VEGLPDLARPHLELYSLWVCEYPVRGMRILKDKQPILGPGIPRDESPAPYGPLRIEGRRILLSDN
jgi:hypothetical protein